MPALLLLTLTAITPDQLRELPNVASVTVHGPADAEQTVVHFADWHLVEDDGLRDYDQHVADVADVHRELVAAIAALKPETVHVEGIAATDKATLAARIAYTRASTGGPPG